jgi:hypothetical protein
MTEPTQGQHRHCLAGPTPLLRRALKVVTPVYVNGAALMLDKSSGSRANVSTGAIM